ncbi:hypothetical protein IVA94_14615 [Bradyrhizobium sp. 156]|uniref:hypothetical protein n=1 Tax=Bradyrhizobium sp. 156 TaxID=2782630 RepID=UPI001FF8B4C0|nr:hypothetical protein [Bradyrhizobium sp. 156]MCK1322101.1 hypothetical protein [Bradyrhizobium sp. 156]
MTDHTNRSAGIGDDWLLVKRGLFYRPNYMGYTGIRDEAGRYSGKAADEHMAAGGKAVREADAPEFMPEAYSDVVIKRLTEQRDDARAKLARIPDAAQPEKMPTSRPVAFRVPRVVDDKLSKTEFRLFDDEDEARRAACDIGADYDGLFLVADRRAAFFAQPDPRLSAVTEGADLLGEMKHGHAEPVANRHYAWAVAEITQLRQKVSKSIDEASFADLRASGGIEPQALLETQAAQVPSEPQRSGNDDLRDLAERLFTDAHRDDLPQVVRFRLKQASEVVRERSAATSGLGKSDMLELSKRIENGLKDDNGDFFAPPLSRKQWWMIASSLDYAARFNTPNEPPRNITKWPDTLGFDDRDKYIDELEAQIERHRAAPAVSDKDLLNWIENEASRGLSEGDAREALTAIKWKIKDGR